MVLGNFTSPNRANALARHTNLISLIQTFHSCTTQYLCFLAIMNTIRSGVMARGTLDPQCLIAE
jgi:cell division protein FtsX